MKLVYILLTGIFLTIISTTPVKSQEHINAVSHSAVQKLIEGNKRYIAGKFIHPNQSIARRKEVAIKQKPFAVILSCSDSRVAPEIIFDQGLGDLFIIRVAGNIVTDEVLGSIEYAVEHLGAHLVVGLGHERCGAVDAAVGGGEVPGHIKSLVDAIKPAVEKARSESGNMLENAIRENVAMEVEKLKTSEPILEHLVQGGNLKIIGGVYDLDDGSVKFSK